MKFDLFKTIGLKKQQQQVEKLVQQAAKIDLLTIPVFGSLAVEEINEQIWKAVDSMEGRYFRLVWLAVERRAKRDGLE